jgi:hypothetical protein
LPKREYIPIIESVLFLTVMTGRLPSRPTENVSACLDSDQARSQSVAWFDGTLPQNKIRQRSLFEAVLLFTLETVAPVITTAQGSVVRLAATENRDALLGEGLTLQCQDEPTPRTTPLD